MEIGLDFIDTPLFFEDELDFGLDGRVPFQLTLTDGHLNISVAQLPLSPDLQIPNLSQDYVASLAGTFEVQGITSVIDDSTPFFGSNVRVTGKDYEVDLNALEAVLHLAIQNTGTFVGPVYTGLLNGKTLEIFVSFSTSGSLGREISAMTGVFDTDGDGFVDLIDNCPTVSNPNQTDTDADGIGDACNDADDLDGDEWSDALDNCVNDPNPGQEDVDFDLIGDICDPFPNDPDNEQAQCDADLTTCSTDFSICDSDLTTCSADLGTAQADLTQCAADEAVLLQSLDDCQTGPPFVGDVNRDGEVNLLDAVLLRRQLAGLPIEPPRPAVTALKLRSTPTDQFIETVENGDVFSIAGLGNGCLAIHVELNESSTSLRYDWTPPGGTEIYAYLWENNDSFCWAGAFQTWTFYPEVADCHCSPEMFELGDHHLVITPCSVNVDFGANETCIGNGGVEGPATAVNFTLAP